jgi:hypothetical protein
MTPCPSQDELLYFIDGALTLEDTDGVRAHLVQCPRCRGEDAALRTLVGDIQAPAGERLDVRAHVQAVMARLDRPTPAEERPIRRWFLAGAASLAAAAAIALALHSPTKSSPETGAWQARGGAAPAGIERDVGVQAYAMQGGPRPLKAGSTIDVNTPLTGGFRNVGRAPVFLLFFAVDGRDEVHWISPEYEKQGTDPAATPLPVTTGEQMLEAAALLDDVTAGPLRIVAVVTETLAHVSDIESLPGAELHADGITRRLPGASVRETIVEMRAAEGGPP